MAEHTLDPELEQEYGNGFNVADLPPGTNVHEALNFNMWTTVSHVCAREGKGVWTVAPRLYWVGEGEQAWRYAGMPYWYGVYQPSRLVDAKIAALEANAGV